MRVMALHPPDPQILAAIRFAGVIPATKPLHVVQAAGNRSGDSLLRCTLNGKTVGEQVLNGQFWTMATFDLSEQAGKQAVAELQSLSDDLRKASIFLTR